MADYSNAHSSTYSGLEVEVEYSNREGHDDHSDKGSISGGSDNGSGGHRSGSDGHHDDDHKGHDRDDDLSDREDGGSDKEDRQSDKIDRQSDRGSRRSDRSDRRSDRSDRRSDRGDGDSHSAHDREGSLHGSHDGSADHRDDLSGDVYDALDEINDLVEHAEAEQTFYSNADDQDRKSDDSHSDGEGEGRPPKVKPRSSVKVAKVDDDDVNEGIYEELPDNRSDSDHSEKGDRARDDHHGAGPSDDLYDDVGVGHARANGHQRRGSRDSDEDNHRSSVDGRVKRQASSNAPTSSGKFMLRTSRKADALHVLRQIRNSTSADDNPELDELVTVLRSTDHNSKHDDNLDEEKQKEKLKSFITSKLIHKFEQGIASEEAFNENHDNFQAADTSRINDRHNTTVVKTTVVKTVKVDANHPVSPQGTGIPKSPTVAVASGSSVASDGSRSSSFSSLSSASQIHQKSVTNDSHGSNHGASKTVTVTTVQVTVNPSRHQGNESPKSPDDSTVPAWKAEIEMRKKTKSHVPTQKPREPMKMSEVPEWKKQLQEKNKMKKLSSSDEPDVTLARVTTVEMDRLKHEVVITHHGGHSVHGAHGGHRGDNHLPEWARLADEKHKTISH